MAQDRIFIGGGGEGYTTPQHMLLGMGNRHGLIAGATGTGKTVTLQILAEGFSKAGVPVFLSDIKGDLSGLALPGSAASKMHAGFVERANLMGLELVYEGFPVTFWDVFGQQGHPIRTTVSELGPLLLSRMLDLSEAQEGVLNIAFRICDEEGWPLLDFKDLTAILRHIGENAKQISTTWGLVSTASVGAIQRRLLVFENEGGAQLLAEPALDLADFMRVDASGKGQVNILASDRLMNSPRLYGTFLLWLLSELFETLPEVGNPEKPKMVFFFDEAHLLFDDAPKALIDKIEQVARLIRSKGVGVYFITQNPADVPDAVLGQLGNRIQHALRAFTAKDQKDLRMAAQTYRANPRFSTEDAIREVGTGEALTSMLEPKGVPGMVERTLIRPPASQVGPIDAGTRAQLIASSPLGAKYNRVIDSDSAHEMLARRAAAAAAAASEGEAAVEAAREFRNARRYSPNTREEAATPKPRTTSGRRSDTATQTFVKSMARQLGSRSGQALVRGILGTLFKSR